VLTRLQANAVPLIAPILLLPETASAISRGQNDPELAQQFACLLVTLDREQHDRVSAVLNILSS
jgi:hypothetical protein